MHKKWQGTFAYAVAFLELPLTSNFHEEEKLFLANFHEEETLGPFGIVSVLILGTCIF